MDKRTDSPLPVTTAVENEPSPAIVNGVGSPAQPCWCGETATFEADRDRLVEQLKARVEREKELSRAANHAGKPELDAYYDGKSMAFNECLYALRALGVPRMTNGSRMQSQREIGQLTVDIYFGVREELHVSGPLGLYPQGVADILNTVTSVLRRNEALAERLSG